jgi:K+-sensing histidine kinase KdpD
MLSNLLSLASIQAGRLEPNTEPVLIKPVAARVAAEVDRRTTRHTIVVDLPADLPPVEADPNLLSQVLRNLLENAVKYSPDGGEIRITASVEHPIVAIHVTDKGVGIASELVGQVFERFRRPGAPPTIRGMGLGLYLSKHLMEAQGGSISASSAGPGQGATFTIKLPIARDWEEN